MRYYGKVQTHANYDGREDLFVRAVPSTRTTDETTNGRTTDGMDDITADYTKRKHRGGF